MYYTREQHKRFLDKELTAISEEYLKKLNSKALALLAENEVYVSQFVKLDLKKRQFECLRTQCVRIWTDDTSVQERQRYSTKE